MHDENDEQASNNSNNDDGSEDKYLVSDEEESFKKNKRKKTPAPNNSNNKRIKVCSISTIVILLIVIVIVPEFRFDLMLFQKYLKIVKTQYSSSNADDNNDDAVSSSNKKKHQHKRITPTKTTKSQLRKGEEIKIDKYSIPKSPPIWSASMRQHQQQLNNNLEQFNDGLEWRAPGLGSKIIRNITEVVVYGLSGVLPWFGARLPALRFKKPFTFNETGIEIVNVPGLVDATLDLQQCGGIDKNKKTIPVNKTNQYDACFPPEGQAGRKPARSLCYLKDQHRNAKNRIHNYPASGHEKWSCSDSSVMSQLVGAQVLDYLISHGDRFYSDRTNNLFFFAKDKNKKKKNRSSNNDNEGVFFVSIDHHPGEYHFLTYHDYEPSVRNKMLLHYDLPGQLREEIKRVVVLGTKHDFLNKLNTTLDSELDNVVSVAKQMKQELLEGELYASSRRLKNASSITNILWNRLSSVAEFYHILPK